MAPTRTAISDRAASDRESPVICSAQVPLRLDATTLVVPPFRLQRLNRRYCQPSEVRIDLQGLAPDRYRVVAVQNFWIEDHSSDLSEAVAGVFLARRRSDGQWEEPENWPIECRTLAVLGYVDLIAPGHWTLAPP